MSEATAAASRDSCSRPYNLIAELTYRCPLRCPYCSNPLDYAKTRDQLSAQQWASVFSQAADLGVLHVGLTGGEPSARRDLPEIVSSAVEAGLYTHLVTSGIPLGRSGLPALKQRGLRSVQLSIQDAIPEASDRIAGTHCFEDKLDFARAVRELELPLTLNVVLHRENLERVEAIIALARELDAEKLELAHVQFHGWARLNQRALMPSEAQLANAADAVRRARVNRRRPEIVHVLQDHFADRPKPCMGGWGRKNIVVTPEGRVQPCQEAGTLELEFWSVGERALADCWTDAPGMNAFRGDSWMKEPCRSCPQKAQDFAGCRCQAFHLTGDASATDPACHLSPNHDRIAAARSSEPENLRMRGEIP
jgi:pyrroloquinoline quinone biosynthesis protein E